MERRSALVVEDDAAVADAIARGLEQAGFDVIVAATGRHAIQVVTEMDPDLVTLDLSLPDLDGLEVCRRLRATSNCYVIIVSARREEIDRLTGLEMGADDFVAKPFSVRELQARVAALFRRPRTRVRTAVHRAPAVPPPAAVPAAAGARPAAGARRSSGSVLDCGAGLHVDPDSREVTIHGTPVDLTRTEFDLLAHLAQRPGVVVRREDMLRTVWSTDFVPEDTHNVDVHLANLRRKLRLHSSATWIRTVRGVGLRLDLS